MIFENLQLLSSVVTVLEQRNGETTAMSSVPKVMGRERGDGLA